MDEMRMGLIALEKILNFMGLPAKQMESALQSKF